MLRVTVQGWRDAAGSLWIPNRLVDVHIPQLGINSRQLLISDVNFSISETGGTQCAMSLCRIQTFLREPLPEKKGPNEKPLYITEE